MKYCSAFLLVFSLQLGTYLLGINNQITDRIIASIPPNAHVGIIVKSVNDDQIIFEHNANQIFMPGSTLKMLTAAVALKHLGPDFTYSTQLLANDNPDLYLKFSGDPSLTAKDLTNLFSSLSQAGIHHINGNIIYEDSGYAAPPINPSWMLSDIHTCEMVPISKAIIDENYYHFEILPGKTLSEPSFLKSKLDIEPRYPIDNQVTTVPDKDYTWRSYGFVENTLCIQGKAGIKLKPQRIELPIDDLNFYIQQNIAKALNENAITLQGQIIHGKTPQNAAVLAEHTSASLDAIISNGLKYSLNVPFGSLLLQLNPSATSWRDASLNIAKTLQYDYSIDLTEAHIDDGIGLSRYNLMSPKQLSDLLTAVYNDSSISSYFINGLAQNGKPGELQNRLTDKTLKNKIYAKAGSMTGVSALAGYLITNKGNLLTFVIFVNGFTGSPQPYKNFQDDLCRTLIEQL